MDDLLLNPSQYTRLGEGLQMTLQVLGLAFVIGVVLSVLFGVARLSHRRVLRGGALIYTEFARGISSIVLLFWMAFALPILLGFSQPSLLLMGSVALGINMGGYGAEIVRGAIQTVPSGQTEASIALNLSNTQRLRYIVLPQALRVILPPMGNLTIEILKGTALVSLVGLSDIAFEADKLRVSRAVSADPVSVPVLFLNVLLLYFVLAQIVNGIFRFAEWRVNRRYHGRPLASTFLLPEAASTIGVPE